MLFYIQGITCECWYNHILKDLSGGWGHAGLDPCPERGLTPGGSNALVPLGPMESHDSAKQEEI